MTTTEIDVMEDPYMTLKEWADKITELIKRYGEDVNMYTDGGYNNVTLVIVDSPRNEEIVCKKER